MQRSATIAAGTAVFALVLAAKYPPSSERSQPQSSEAASGMTLQRCAVSLEISCRHIHSTCSSLPAASLRRFSLSCCIAAIHLCSPLESSGWEQLQGPSLQLGGEGCLLKLATTCSSASALHTQSRLLAKPVTPGVHRESKCLPRRTPLDYSACP